MKFSVDIIISPVLQYGEAMTIETTVSKAVGNVVEVTARKPLIGATVIWDKVYNNVYMTVGRSIVHSWHDIIDQQLSPP